MNAGIIEGDDGIVGTACGLIIIIAGVIGDMYRADIVLAACTAGDGTAAAGFRADVFFFGIGGLELQLAVWNQSCKTLV
jgi:hypothetical protein